MIPGLNSREMLKAMKKLGIKQEEIDALEVVIRCSDKEIVVRNPEVLKVNLTGKETFQVSGDIEEREPSTEPEISKDDVKTIVDQTSVSEDQALVTLKKNKGDIAATILELQNA